MMRLMAMVALASRLSGVSRSRRTACRSRRCPRAARPARRSRSPPTRRGRSRAGCRRTRPTSSSSCTTTSGRPARHLRRRHPHADVVAHREERHLVQPLPQRRVLLADAGRAAHRAQPPPIGFGQIAELANDWDGYTGRCRRPRRRWRRCSATTATRPPRSGSGTTRRRRRRPSRDRSTSGRPGAGRLRLLLRLPGGRVVAMGAGGGREHRAPARAAPRGLPLHRGHGRQGGDLDSPAPGACPGHAVLDVLGARRRARAAPHLQGVGRQVQGQVRRRLGRDAHPHLRAAEAARLDPGEHPAHAAPGLASRVAGHSRRREAVPAPPDGTVRRHDRARRRAGRAAHRRARAPWHPRQHAHLLHFERQRLLGRGPERQHQRAPGAKRHPHRGQGPHPRAERAGRPRRPRHQQDRQHVPRRLGLGGQHALPGDQARRLALWRHAHADGGVLAEVDQARRGDAHAVPPRERHRADDLRRGRDQGAEAGGRRDAGADGRRQHEVHLRRRPGTRTQEEPVLRGHGQPRDLPGRLDRLGVRAAHSLATGAATGHRHLVAGPGHVGAVRPALGLLAGRRSCRQDTRRRSRR